MPTLNDSVMLASNSRNRRRFCSAVVAVTFGVLTMPTGADTLELSWYTIDGGGINHAVSGDLELSATVGQWDAAGPFVSGDLELTTGFWFPVGSRFGQVPIPTVSTWGLVIMALGLAVLAKAYFGTRNQVSEI